MRRLYVIGIGAGDPDHLTVQAIKAMNEVDVFFVVEKRDERRDLVELRTRMIAEHVDRPHRLVYLEEPERDRGAAAYAESVEAWRRERAEVWGRAVSEELGEDQRGGFLVWGDPALYDSTLAVLDQVAGIEYEVIPGISSVQALAARHGVPLNRVGGAIQITTGRRLANGFPAEADDVVVMLDADCTFKSLAPEGLDIYWGAYVGTEDELLVSGALDEVADEIERTRSEARARKGWIMDTYLLRRRRG
jgi:precorrin-6A synthase